MRFESPTETGTPSLPHYSKFAALEYQIENVGHSQNFWVTHEYFVVNVTFIRDKFSKAAK